MDDVTPTSVDVFDALKRISSYVVETPCVRNRVLDQAAGCELYFKCENLQTVGAFKFRGACNAVLKLTPEQRARGVFTVSSGNHGAALAEVGRQLGIPVTVGVPRNAPSIKQDNIRRGGATIEWLEPGMAAREAFTQRFQQQTGQTFIPPYDHPDIIAGQGTAMLEFGRQIEGLDTIVAPLGGGGLLSGTCLAAQALNGQTVFGAEPELARDAYDSLRLGERQPALPPASVCDGLLTQLGKHPFAILQNNVAGVLLVSDDEVLAAMQSLVAALKLVIEPSAAITYAAVLKYPEHFRGKRVGIILSGGNTDRVQVAKM
ncbi:serine/threonine dehydratase [Idiomarina tyrosinivorans]|uniref:Serine/threonine dehydratase n=1 Tax=Idiomarina tyrosinivorans TaxID=1445662 RepID=A0A432ZTH0_9GAMM|nr:threonine/serine dehydratase [Idiomarina tyrosinivorans]RUO81118.1 serine/threonine dehydratase [Idiomarina tyrosinivorans]